MLIDHLYLAMAWIAWCAVHSLLIDTGFTCYARTKLGQRYKYYRFGYNVFSFVTFFIVLYYESTVAGDVYYLWVFPWSLIRYAGLFGAGLFFFLGARVYNNQYFLGFEQMSKGIPDSPEQLPLSRAGVLHVVRHPYYTGAILLVLFIDHVSATSIVAHGILIVYIVIGTILEERKLLAEYGDSYRSYMKDVPRFFPRIIPRKTI